MTNQTDTPTRPSTAEKRARFRSLISAPEILVSPGVYDGYSARLVARAGFKAASTSGAGISNARLGQPDIGLMSLTENLDACRHLSRSIDIPLTADAETGYGNAVTVHHVIEYFEEAGVAGVNLEDQVSPKRCGHMKGKEVISRAEMGKKIEAACAARRDQNFAIVARTDALAVEGLESTITRAKHYRECGADMLFPDAVRTADDIARIVEECALPVSVNMGFGIRSRPTTPLITPQQLEAIGVARVSYARMLPAASIMAMQQALQVLKQVMATGEPADRPDLLAGIDEIMALMDYDRIDNLERRYMLDEELERRYADGGGIASSARSRDPAES